jgi:hypothetical protein
MARKTFRATILLASSLFHSVCSAEDGTGNAAATTVPRAPVEAAMQIRIRAGDRILTARLEDSAATRDFVALLPIELTLKDYASTEKIATLPRQLSTEGTPPGVDPTVGDIAYYAPWGNLAIYYRDFGYSRGLVRLGRIEADAEALRSLEGPVTIENIDNQRR